MQIYHGLEGLRQLPPRAAMSIGNFDGVHLGHASIIEMCRRVCATCDEKRVQIVTFEPHPLTVLRPQFAPPRISPPDVKKVLLEKAGVHDLVILPPTRDLLDLTAEKFWSILHDEIRPAHLIEGHTFTFGKGRGGTVHRLREWSADEVVKLHVIEPVTVPLLDLQLAPVSSSLIRWLLAHGRVRDAAICLGRSFSLHGEVVKGYERGRTIGVPTANLDIRDQLIPLDGVYAGRCTVDGMPWAAAVSIGSMPTFGENRRQVEAHLIGFEGDLYGQILEVQLVDWLRDQRRYGNVELLKQQLNRDIDETGARLSRPSHQPIARANLASVP